MPNRSREIWRSGLGKYEFVFRCEFEASPNKSVGGTGWCTKTKHQGVGVTGFSACDVFSFVGHMLG